MKAPRINITYDFEPDNEDIKEYERSLRKLHPVDEYPYFDDGEGYYDDDDHSVYCTIEGVYPGFAVNGRYMFFDRIRRCRGQR